MTEPDYKAFALAIMGGFPDLWGLDGCDLQELALKHGLLREEQRTVPCDPEACQCAEVYMHGETVTCYRRNWPTPSEEK